MPESKIYVTVPSLPELDDFIPSLREIWNSRWLTNNGGFHQRLEAALAEYLGVRYVSLFTNGMLALQIGMQALRISGEVITTPFTFAATTHAVHLNNCTPVFCDIREDDFTLDPVRVEALITPRTAAIMPVHVYGNPCRHEELKKIADTCGLKLFYDAAHAFGVRKDGVGVCNWGDLSMLSFHATKVFNTFEGGALIMDDIGMKRRVDFLKNFGFADEVTVVAPGGNGKMDEFRAALGLLQLEHIDREIDRRRAVVERYRAELRDVPGLKIFFDRPGVRHNYSYFPVLVDEAEFGMGRDALYSRLREHGIMARRYFYPLCSDFPTYRGLPSAAEENLPVASRISRQILCLPVYADLASEDQSRVIRCVLSARGGR